MSVFRRSIGLIIALSHLTFVSLAGVPSSVLAQSDGEPPSISFERIAEGVRGETQVFSATVSDDFTVESVTLRYRFGEDTAYLAVPMKPLNGTDIYTVSVDTADTDEDVLQYYVEARDGAGNRSIQGFAFDPIERRLIERESPFRSGLPVLVTVPEPVRTDGMSTGRKVLYGVLGVLAVGAVVAAAGGDSGGGGGERPRSDDPRNAPLDIIVDPLP